MHFGGLAKATYRISRRSLLNGGASAAPLGKVRGGLLSDVSLFRHALGFSAQLTHLSLLIIVLLTLFLGFVVELDPSVEALNGHAPALGDPDDRLVFIGHLLDRFDLEFFRVTLASRDTSCFGLIMRLGGV